jgi:hypothetical protein
MKGAGAALILLIVACGSPAAGQSPASSVRTESPSPVVTGALNCRIPVSMAVHDNTSISGGFIDLSSGVFVADPTSAYSLDPSGKGLRSATQPYLYAEDSRDRMFYDRTRSRWLAVTPDAVSSDGAAYAYALPDASLRPAVVHVVDVATGVEKTFPVQGIRLIPVPLAYEAGSVYLTEGYEGTDGLWQLDPGTGAVRKLSDISFPTAYRNGELWYPTPHPTLTIHSDTINRLDVATGKTTVWFHRSGGDLWVEGLDTEGHPVIANYLPGHDQQPFAELWSVPSPGVATKLFTGGIYDKEFVMADQHGLWFGAADGLYLYSQNGGLQRVSGKAVVPAGTCV